MDDLKREMWNKKIRETLHGKQHTEAARNCIICGTDLLKQSRIVGYRLTRYCSSACLLKDPNREK